MGDNLHSPKVMCQGHNVLTNTHQLTNTNPIQIGHSLQQHRRCNKTGDMRNLFLILKQLQSIRTPHYWKTHAEGGLTI